MDEITQQYQQAAQAQLQHIEEVARAFQNKCLELKNEAEQKISALDKNSPQYKGESGKIKLKLKDDLATVLVKMERELKRSFGIGLIELENIYHQREIQSIIKLEEQILAL